MDSVVSDNQVKMVTVGSWKITLAALITLISGLVLAVVFLFMGRFGLILSMWVLLLFVLASYNVNCAQMGHCRVWAWTLTILYVVYVTIIAVAALTKKETILAKLNKKV